MNEVGSKVIELPPVITVRDLAQQLDVSPIQVIKVLMGNGVMANINQQIDYDTAGIVAAELGFEVRPQIFESEEKEEQSGEIPLWRQLLEQESPEKLQARPPVVAVLGHVDHGKTTLLDAIRNTRVAEGEAGGITQHVGAYQVNYKGKLITFLDTPGHAAFTAMRARGAQGADVVVLVVAADDGVMPQTREAIAHANAARVPIVVALNKIDKANANPDFVKHQLGDLGLVPDEWGGNTLVVPVSAKQRLGLEDLMEAILLVGESAGLRANPSGRVFGTVVESSIDRQRGVQATLLVQNGTLHLGDVVVCRVAYGKIRAMQDFRGKPITKAGPSTPAQISGLSEPPAPGEFFEIVGTEKEARQIVEGRKQQSTQAQEPVQKATLEDLFARFQTGEEGELRLILKTDVEGSLEPITQSIGEIDQSQIRINVLHADAGNISESDVMLASASKAVIIGFNVDADPSARRLAETEGVDIRLYSIIYELVDDLKKALKGMLAPVANEVVVGKAQVLAIFSISRVGNIAGSRVIEGTMRRNGHIRVMRKGQKAFEGDIASMRHEKENIREARTGVELGLSLKGFNDFEVGDILECYVLEFADDEKNSKSN
jgi:translation initiation factor IF-2